MMKKAPITVPEMKLAVTWNGTCSGSMLWMIMFQSNVGKGLNPRPFLLPVMAVRVKLSGWIHAIQLNRLSAVKM